MGLLKAGTGALGGVLADQWKEFFYCDAMDGDTLVKKGQKRTGKRSSNTKGDDNIITNGSVIAIADGQCMIIVDPQNQAFSLAIWMKRWQKHLIKSESGLHLEAKPEKIREFIILIQKKSWITVLVLRHRFRFV